MAKRFPTKYPGIFYRIAPRVGSSGTEHVFYAVYKKDGKLVETKVGRQYSDAMTAARAANIRSELIDGKRLPNAQELKEKKKEASLTTYTVNLQVYAQKNVRTRWTAMSQQGSSSMLPIIP